MKRYFAKHNTWFDEGTEAVPATKFWNYVNGGRAAVFMGIRNGKPDEEVCMVSEFDIVDD